MTPWPSFYSLSSLVFPRTVSGNCLKTRKASEIKVLRGGKTDKEALLGANSGADCFNRHSSFLGLGI